MEITSVSFFQKFSLRKKPIIIFLFLFFVSKTTSFANDSFRLKERLNQTSSFSASFKQSLINSEGTVVQESNGKLWMKRPNLFHWHTISPDESILVSDGKTVWFYNPLLEQVTAYWLKTIINNTLFMLIIDIGNDAAWQNYKVIQKGDSFSLVSRLEQDKENLKQFTIQVTTNGIIKEFTTVDYDGYKNSFEFNHQKNIPIGDERFHFIIPDGVALDDQREQFELNFR